MAVYYNRNIDQIAMICPFCESVHNKLDRLSDRDLKKYAEHLRIEHGLTR